MDTVASPSVRAGARRSGTTGVGAARPVTVDRSIAIATAVVVTALVVGIVVAVPGGAVRAALVAAAGVAAMVPAAVVDARTNRLPDRLVGAAALVVAAAWTLAVVPAVVVGSGPSAIGTALGDVVLGIGATAGPLLALHVLSPTAMGFGDVKAAAVLGATVAAIDGRLDLVVLALASAVAAAVALARRRSAIAFGPFLVGAAWIVVLVWSLVGLDTEAAGALTRLNTGGIAP